MKLYNASWIVLFGVFFSLTISGCDDHDNDPGTNRALVTVQGRVDDGTATSPIANARCRFVELHGSQLAATIADANGAFRFDVLPNKQGFIECTPPELPNLVLSAFMSTMGAAAGETLPKEGPEEVSPRTTVVVNIMAQTVPADLQARKAELLAAIDVQDPDLTMLVHAATELFNALLEQQVAEADFSPSHGESDESGEGGGDGGGDGSSDGVAGEAGDGAEFSPLRDAQCEFMRDPRGDTALEDLLLDGTLDRPDLQAIAADVAQDARMQEAFAKLFLHGMQPLVNGQPLRTITDANGMYFLPVPPNTPGIVRCASVPHLAVSTFVRGRQTGETLTDQNVSPSSQIFTAFIIPQLTAQDVQAVENNFLTDIGDLQIPSDGIVRLETVETPAGQVIADRDGDGLVCSLLVDTPQAGAIEYVAAGATSYTAIALFKALLIEARNPASSRYETILANVLTRRNAVGNPRVVVLAEDLLAGGVPAARATALAASLNACIRFGVEEILGTTLPSMVRRGRFRVEIRDVETNMPIPNIRVGGEGNITAASECRDAQGGMISPIIREENLIVCRTDEDGRVTFILEGEAQLAATSVAWSVRTEEDEVLGQVNADFIPAVSIDAVVAVPRRP
jgi:hypothetical protein